MSGVTEFYRLNSAFAGDCPALVENWLSGGLVFFNYYPVILIATTLGLSIYHADLFFFFFGIWLTLDTFINYGFRLLFAVPPVTVGCGPEYELPSFASQHAAVFVTVIWTFLVIYNYRVGIGRTLMAVFLFGGAMFARLYIGIASPLQLLVGALFGMPSGVVFMVIMYYGIAPHVSTLLNWRLVVFMGWNRGFWGEAQYRNDENDNAIMLDTYGEAYETDQAKRRRDHAIALNEQLKLRDADWETSLRQALMEFNADAAPPPLINAPIGRTNTHISAGRLIDRVRRRLSQRQIAAPPLPTAS